jgi:hypothetical protein
MNNQLDINKSKFDHSFDFDLTFLSCWPCKCVKFLTAEIMDSDSFKTVWPTRNNNNLCMNERNSACTTYVAIKEILNLGTITCLWQNMQETIKKHAYVLPLKSKLYTWVSSRNNTCVNVSLVTVLLSNKKWQEKYFCMWFSI